MKITQKFELSFGSLISAFRIWGAGCAFLSLGLSVAFAQGYYYGPQAYRAPAYYNRDEAGDDFGFYLNCEIGPSFMPDFQSSRFGFPGSFSAQPGVRFGVQPGFNFVSISPLALGAEFETGVIYNYLNSIQNAGAPTPLRGDYYQVPVLGNLVLRFHTGSIVVPYLGVGGGGDYSSARIHTPGFFGYETTSGEFDPAAQALAGIHFELSPATEAGLGYKYLADFPDEGKRIGTHSVLASFRVKF